eukprot:s900_g12.t1
MPSDKVEMAVLAVMARLVQYGMNVCQMQAWRLRNGQAGRDIGKLAVPGAAAQMTLLDFLEIKPDASTAYSPEAWWLQWCSEPRYQGWTAKEWQDWIAEPAGATWCENKRYEADWIVDWMIRHWGMELLRGGVLDVGGEPGFLAAALLARGISVTVVDPTWGVTGKAHWSNDCMATAHETGAKLSAFSRDFDERFLVDHPEMWQLSVVVSLYGDEATIPALMFAVDAGKPSAIVPCNECAHFFPDHNKTYEGYCEALLEDAWWRGGHFQLVLMEGREIARATETADKIVMNWGWANTYYCHIQYYQFGRINIH